MLQKEKKEVNIKTTDGSELKKLSNFKYIAAWMKNTEKDKDKNITMKVMLSAFCLFESLKLHTVGLAWP